MLFDRGRQIWSKLSTLGVNASHSSEEQLKIVFINKCYLIGLLFCLFLIPVELFTIPIALFITATISVALVYCLYLSSINKHELAWHLGLCAVLITLTISPILYGPCPSIGLYFINIYIIVVFCFESRQIQYIYLGLTLLTLLLFTTLSLDYESIASVKHPIFFNTVIVVSNMVILKTVLKLHSLGKEQHLQQIDYSASLTKAALDATPNGIIAIDQKGKIRDYNQKLISIWNIPDTLIAKWDARVLSEFMAEQLKKPDLLLGQKDLFNDLYTTVVKFGELTLQNGRVIEYHSHPQVLHQKIVGRVISFNDVSAKRKIQKKIEASELRFRTIFNLSPIGMVLGVDQRFLPEYTNSQFCKMLGYTPEELANVTVEDITYKEDQNIRPMLMAELKNKGTTNFSVRKRYLKKTGEIVWGKVNIAIVKDKEGYTKDHIVMVEDITKQMEQEEQIRQLLLELRKNNDHLEEIVQKRTIDLQTTNDELVRSNEDLEQFAYIASHDLQEPLRMVGNFVQLLERQYKDSLDTEGRSYIQFAVEGVTRMSKLMQNLLKYSRVGRGDIHFRSANINNLVEVRLLDLAHKIKETKTEFDISPLPDSVFCEASQIGIVFYNLISNALKFNKETHPKIEIGGAEKEKEWLFYVKDNGIGIEPKFKDKIFEIFKRLNRREDYEGTGIGLALCKKIISRHKGSIWFESETGQGTTFYFTIKKGLTNESSVQSYSDTLSRR